MRTPNKPGQWLPKTKNPPNLKTEIFKNKKKLTNQIHEFFGSPVTAKMAKHEWV